MALKLRKLYAGILLLTLAAQQPVSTYASLTQEWEIEEGKNQEQSRVFEHIRNTWAEQMTMNNLYGTSDKDYLESVASVTESAKILWGRMTPYDPSTGPDTRTELWSQYTTDKVSSQISYCFSNFKKMATAYKAKGSELYGNEQLLQDILYGLEWMYDNRYNENVGTIYDNWFHWNISSPQELGFTLVLLYDELSEEQLEEQLRAIYHFNKDPFISINIYNKPQKMEAANLLDKLFVKVLEGILKDSPSDMAFVAEAMCTVLPYVTDGNGFYEDGSYIDHGADPYAGGYGGSLMRGLSRLQFTLQETPWEVANPLINNCYDWIINAFEPLYYKGAIMDMVSGRGVAVANKFATSDHTRGKSLLIYMINLAQTAPEEKKVQILSFIKENILSDEICEEYFSGMNINDILLMKDLLADENIPARGDLMLSKVYGAMDRAVHHRPGFSLGISMFSTRVSAFETGNGENLRPWHTADGMMYLYNDDHDQFTDSFWPTIDQTRMPGTTTDRSKRRVKSWYDYFSSKDWVGGATINDLYGAVGMEFEMEPGRSNLTGKKSWFLFDDEIVALGAGINATGNRLVETMVENRKIKDDGTNTLLVNGEVVQSEFGESKFSNANWALLSGNTEAGTDTIGYYFPDSIELAIKKEARTGAWREIYTKGPTDPITKNYMSLAIEHTNAPIDGTYSYVLLPNKLQEEVKAYSQGADISILANDKDVQAVKENKLGIIGMNFWNPATVEYITANEPCSVMLEEKGDILKLGIADPTHLSEEVSIIVDKADYVVKEMDDTVTVQQIDEGIKITVRTDKSQGKTHKVELLRKSSEQGTTNKIQIPTQVSAGEEFEGVISMEQIKEEIYAQDIVLSYDERILEVKQVEGINKTEIVAEKIAAGKWRILAATEDGLVEGGENVRITFQAKNVSGNKKGTIDITQGNAGVVNEGRSYVIQINPISEEIAVNRPDVSGEIEDVNKDNKVDIADLALIAYYYQKESGQPGWEQAKVADINKSGKVEIGDLSQVANKILEK